MRPDPPVVLQGIAVSMFTQVVPDVRTAFGQSLAGTVGMLNLILAQEFDRAADRLVKENVVLVDLLEDAARVVGDDSLGQRVAGCRKELSPDGFLVSTLQAANDRLRAVLIDVHAAVEATEGEAAEAMNERIWDELRESTRRRHTEVPR